MVAILFALLSMKVTRIVGMPVFSNFHVEFEDLSELSEEKYCNDHYNTFLYKRIQQWKTTHDSIRQANQRKAKLVNISQVACGCGLILIGLVAITILNSCID